MSHAFTADLLFCNLNPASVAHNTPVTDTLVLTAVALIVLYRTEDPLAKEAVPFRFISTVVDSLRLQNFPTGAFQYLFR
jgi:hypothetical protein